MNFKVTFRKTELLVEVQKQFILNVKIFFKDHESQRHCQIIDGDETSNAEFYFQKNIMILTFSLYKKERNQVLHLLQVSHKLLRMDIKYI